MPTSSITEPMLSLPALCDAFPDELRVAEPILASFGGLDSFHGPAATVRCFEDNSKVKELASEPGEGRVMVVDGGGSIRRALLGDQVAARAQENGWAGFVIHGAVRDVEILETLEIGVLALAPIPIKTEKRGLGDVGEKVVFAGISVSPWEHV
ncbi:MAG: ribonuclease E activity regulator RraA, partial [Holophagales bacterium]|nr:ribonuclease E activity regulator RraA [Holophagales bacterium]